LRFVNIRNPITRRGVLPGGKRNFSLGASAGVPSIAAVQLVIPFIQVKSGLRNRALIANGLFLFGPRQARLHSAVRHEKLPA
jgi:hypothetical protein